MRPMAMADSCEATPMPSFLKSLGSFSVENLLSIAGMVEFAQTIHFRLIIFPVVRTAEVVDNGYTRRGGREANSLEAGTIRTNAESAVPGRPEE